jgi:radical SAM protein with 4Fe4S-binding SPASM domain
VSSRKRWQEIYQEENPFALPQAIMRGLEECGKEEPVPEAAQAKVEYLWMHLPGEVDVNGCQLPPQERQNPLALDEWLDIIDESASCGVRTLIVSIGRPISEHPHLITIGDWAQVSHDMMVGVHLYGRPLCDNDAQMLAKLDLSKTRLFIDEEFLYSAKIAEDLGIRVHNAEGINDSERSPACELPSTMTCVGATGNMYTCGLVLGKEQFRFGHFFERKLSSVMKDATLPHSIPEELTNTKHRCNGCPPLMAKKLRDDTL